MKKSSGLQTGITIVGVLLIFIIAYSDRFDVALILPVLGGLCLLLGIIGLVRQCKLAAGESGREGQTGRCLLQIILGGFVGLLGIVKLADLNLPQQFWNGTLVVIVLIALCWMLIRNYSILKRNKNN